MEKHLYDIWLQKVLLHRSTHIKALMTLFGTSENIYRADEQTLRIAGLLNGTEMNRAINKDLDEARRILFQAKEQGIEIVAYDDTGYPASLRQIADPPLVLYLKGTMPPLTGMKVAVVGTREPTTDGKRLAFDFSYDLTKKKALIISGGALGIDEQAHLGALQAGGKTICVLGHGILSPYKSCNRDLRKEISRHGVLLSEYPPDSEVQKFTFIDRNRIISALSDCTLIVEAGPNSGALFTAGCAAAQDKPLFVIPGHPNNPKALGTNNLLRSGAMMALRSDDLLDWYASGLHSARALGQRLSEKEIQKIRKLSEPVPLLFLPPTSATPAPDTPPPALTEQAPPADVPAPEPERLSAEAAPALGRTTVPAQKEHFSPSVTADHPSVKPKSAATTPKKTDNPKKIPDNLLTAEVKSVYDTISESPKDAVMIAQRIGMPVKDVMAALTELELLELIRPSAFGQYVRK